MRLRNCLGMIWSVSTLGRSSGVAVEVRTLMGCMLFRLLRVFKFPVADIGEVPGDRCGSGHLRTDEVGAPSSALAAFEVAVAGRGAAFAGGAPVEACAGEDFVEAFFFGLRFHSL